MVSVLAVLPVSFSLLEVVGALAMVAAVASVAAVVEVDREAAEAVASLREAAAAAASLPLLRARRFPSIKRYSLLIDSPLPLFPRRSLAR